jgi:YD repeat-containing protein
VLPVVRLPEHAARTRYNRLQSVTNHENGTTSYKYDAKGHLKKKRDARNIEIVYNYDALHRNITVDYSNTTINPDHTRNYRFQEKEISRSR